MKALKSALRLLVAAIACTDLVSSQEDYSNSNSNIEQLQQDRKFVEDAPEPVSPSGSVNALNSKNADQDEEEPELVILVPAEMAPGSSTPANDFKKKTAEGGLDGTGDEEMSVVDFVRRSRERVRERRASSHARRRLGDDDDDGKGKGTKSSGKGKGALLCLDRVCFRCFSPVV